MPKKEPIEPLPNQFSVNQSEYIRNPSGKQIIMNIFLSGKTNNRLICAFVRIRKVQMGPIGREKKQAAMNGDAVSAFFDVFFNSIFNQLIFSDVIKGSRVDHKNHQPLSRDIDVSGCVCHTSIVRDVDVKWSRDKDKYSSGVAL